MPIAALMLLFVSALMPQQSGADRSNLPSPAIAHGEALMENGRTLLNSATLLDARAIFNDCVSHDHANFQCLYDRARTDSWMQKAEAAASHSAEAARWLDTAITDTLAALNCNDRSANAHALLGDLYGAKITGMFSGMRYGPKANAEVAKAFQLDPRNAMAFAAQGRKYLYAPSAFGGDVDKAIESFQKAIATDPGSDDDYVWLAIAWRKKGDTVHEREALSQAMQMNPHSIFAQRVSEGKG
jgi:tetratricopeptide (TPR) repeat protein